MDGKRKGLSAWQLTMLALGTVIGGSFFIGSSIAIHAAGPAVLISYIIGGFLVYFILYALSDMVQSDFSTGSFQNFASKEFGMGAGFVVGWVYWNGMVLAMSSEAAAVSILVRSWIPNISIAFLGSMIIIAVTLVNLLGADKLSNFESSLASVKILAIIFFIIIAILLITGVLPVVPASKNSRLVREPFMPGGIKGVLGSMLIVLFSYAGFEVIGLTASDTENPRETIPKAINYTVISLVGLYIFYIIVLLPLIPTSSISEKISPMVAALDRHKISLGGSIINLILITAILSTMLAAMFGLGRMIRSLTDDGYAPKQLKDKTNVPYRGILFSGFSMLLGFGIGLLFPKVYLFLVSSGGFAILFTYAVILATHIHFCKRKGKKAYTSWIALISIIASALSMPFIKGQGSGLIAGIIMTVFYTALWIIMKFKKRSKDN